MKLTVKICKIIIILLGAFIIMMSLDSFSNSNETIFRLIVGFLINASPGIILIALVVLLWNQEKILGVIILAGAIGLFILFKFYQDTSDKWLTILIVEVPMLVTSGLLIGYKKT